MTKSVGTPAPNPFPMLDSVMWPNSLCIQFQSVSKNRQQSHASILKRGRGGVSSEEKNSKCTKIDCRRDPAPLIGLSLSGLLDFILPVYFLLFFFLVFSKKSRKNHFEVTSFGGSSLYLHSNASFGAVRYNKFSHFQLRAILCISCNNYIY